MKLILKSFSQDVDLSNPDEVLYFLVFDAEGREVRLPVPEQTTQALIGIIYGGKSKAAEASEPQFEDDPEEVGAFGGDFSPTLNQDRPDEEYEESEALADDYYFPQSEESIPSL